MPPMATFRIFPSGSVAGWPCGVDGVDGVLLAFGSFGVEPLVTYSVKALGRGSGLLRDEAGLGLWGFVWGFKVGHGVV